MILSNEAKNASIAAALQIDPDLFALMRGLTVKITCNAFTGTGLVLGVKQQDTLILTAKHNVSMAIDQYSEKTVGKFLKKAEVSLVAGQAGLDSEHGLLRGRVSYRAPVPTAVTSKVAAVAPKDEDTIMGNGYDVAVLRVKDAQFSTRVNNFLKQGFVGMFTPFRSKGPFWEAFQDSRGANLDTFLYDYNGSASRGYHFFQFGHGKVGKNDYDDYDFRFRALPVDTLRSGLTMMDTTHEGFKNVLSFPSTDDNSGWSGDSGGPLFVTDPYGSAYLLGVYLGSNFYANKESDEDDVDNNALSVVNNKSIAKLVKALY